MKDHIFFPAHVAFLHMLEFSCFIGYRKDIQNNICVDVDECKIMRHYCDSSRSQKLCSTSFVRNICDPKVSRLDVHQNGIIGSYVNCPLQSMECSACARSDIASPQVVHSLASS